MTACRLVLSAIALSPITLHATTYQFTIVNYTLNPDVESTTLTGINNSGVISGYYEDFEGTLHDFIYDHGVFTNVEPPACFGYAPMWGINDNGEVSGECDTAAPNSTGHHAYVGAPDNWIFIRLKNAESTSGGGINNAGYSVGGCLCQNGRFSFLAHQGTPVKFSTPSLHGINNKNAVVGTVGNQGYFSNGSVHFTYSVPGASSTAFYAISDGGRVVGQADSAAFVLTQGNASFLDVPGALSSSAYGINNAGVIVGNFSPARFSYSGFIATPQ